MTDLVIFPQSWLPSAIVDTYDLRDGWQLLTLMSSERVVVHPGTKMIYRKLSVEEVARWMDKYADQT
jgi:hypothetical protein